MFTKRLCGSKLSHVLKDSEDLSRRDKLCRILICKVTYGCCDLNIFNYMPYLSNISNTRGKLNK